MAAGSSLASRLIGTRITTGGEQTMNSLTLTCSLNFFFPLQLSTPSAIVAPDRFPTCSHAQGGRQWNAKEKSYFLNEGSRLGMERSKGNCGNTVRWGHKEEETYVTMDVPPARNQSLAETPMEEQSGHSTHTPHGCLGGTVFQAQGTREKTVPHHTL